MSTKAGSYHPSSRDARAHPGKAAYANALRMNRFKSGEISSGAAWFPPATAQDDPATLKAIEQESARIHATPYTLGAPLQVKIGVRASPILVTTRSRRRGTSGALEIAHLVG